MRRFSLRIRNSKRQQRPQVTTTTPAQPDHSRVSVIESDTSGSFSGSNEWGDEDAIPNNNLNEGPGVDPRLSYYQTPASALHTSSPLDTHYKRPSIADYHNDSWSRNTTFSSANEGQHACQQPSDSDYYSSPRNNEAKAVSKRAISGNKPASPLQCILLCHIIRHICN